MKGKSQQVRAIDDKIRTSAGGWARYGMTIHTAAAARARSEPKLVITKKPASSPASVYEINPLADLRWDVFINSHPHSSVFHSTRWLKALQTTYGYKPMAVTSCAPNAALTNGLVFCRVESWLTGRRFVSLPFADHCEPLVSSAAELDPLLSHMKQYVDSGHWNYVEIRPTIGRPESRTGFSPNLRYRFHTLDLHKNSQELFRSFHKDCIQRKIRRADREELRYEEGTSELLLRKFYELLVVTRRRQCLPAQPLVWFRRLIDSFGADLKIRVASKNDLPIASILTLTHKSSMVYKYGCSDARFHRFGGMAFLFWNAIQEAKEKGLEEFEMGRSDSANLGLVAFKERWGTTASELTYWTYPHRPAAALSVRQKIVLDRVIPFTPTFALSAIGKIFYRHAG
jgi:hypothetical protein